MKERSEKPWDLRIRVAIHRPGVGAISAAMAELTARDETRTGIDDQPLSCHNCRELAALFPPGDCYAEPGDGLYFGPNKFLIDRIEVIGEGVRARRKYTCRREGVVL